jgi:hypothetical protein
VGVLKKNIPNKLALMGRGPRLACALKSPAGTTEKVRIGNSQSRNILDGSVLGILKVTASRPYGTFRPSNLNPGLRPGLSSAVPAGLILPSVLTHTLWAPRYVPSGAKARDILNRVRSIRAATPSNSHIPRMRIRVTNTSAMITA